MACHEIAALRLGLMRVIGIDDEAERVHELAELGEGANQPGPVRALCGAQNLGALKRSYEAAISELEARVSSADKHDPKLGYYRTLIVLTKKVELDLQHQIDGITQLYRDLDAMHELVHEIYPAD